MHSKKPEVFDASDWEFVSSILKRSPKECENKWMSMKKSRSTKKSWTSKEDHLLTKIIKYF